MSSTTIPRDESAPAIGRRFVRKVLGGYPKAAETAEIVVSELITNAVLHEEASNEPLSLAVETSEDSARLLVGLTHHDRIEMKEPEGVTGGFGLRIVKAMSTRWGIRAGTMPAVWAEISLTQS